MEDRELLLKSDPEFDRLAFTVLVYFLIWYMIQQSDRLLAARRRQHYEALQSRERGHNRVE